MKRSSLCPIGPTRPFLSACLVARCKAAKPVMHYWHARVWFGRLFTCSFGQVQFASVPGRDCESFPILPAKQPAVNGSVICMTFHISPIWPALIASEQRAAASLVLSWWQTNQPKRRIVSINPNLFGLTLTVVLVFRTGLCQGQLPTWFYQLGLVAGWWLVWFASWSPELFAGKISG